MATVIDRLVVELGLDPKNFSRGQQEALDKFKKTREGVEREGKDIEEGGKRIGTTLSGVQGQVLGLLTTFLGVGAVKAFVSNFTTANSALGRTATLVGMNTAELAAWQRVAIRTGGTAEGISGSLGGVVQELEKITHGLPSQMISPLNALNVEAGRLGATGVNLVEAFSSKGPTEFFLQLSEVFSKLRPESAALYGNLLNLDQATVGLLIKGRPALEAMRNEAIRIGVVTEPATKAAQRMQGAWNDLSQAVERVGNSLTEKAEPYLTSWMQKATEILTTNKVAAESFTTIGLAVAGLIALRPVVWLVQVAARMAALGARIAALGTIKPAAWLLRLLGLGGIVPAAAITAGGVLLTPTNKSGKEDVLDKVDKQGNLTDEGRRQIELEKAERGRLGLGPVPQGQRPVDLRPGVAYQEAGDDIAKLVAMGWSREQAIGVAANLHRESAGKTTGTGDGGQAYGLAQWHPDRQRAFAAFTGHDIRQSTRDEQLAFINHELRGTEQTAGAALRAAKTAAEAAAVFSQKYERPADQAGEANRRATLAAEIERALRVIAPVAPATAAPAAVQPPTLPTRAPEPAVAPAAAPPAPKPPVAPIAAPTAPAPTPPAPREESLPLSLNRPPAPGTIESGPRPATAPPLVQESPSFPGVKRGTPWDAYSKPETAPNAPPAGKAPPAGTPWNASALPGAQAALLAALRQAPAQASLGASGAPAAALAANVSYDNSKSSTTTVHSETKIDRINVTTSEASAPAIGRDLVAVIERSSMAGQANYGLTG